MRKIFQYVGCVVAFGVWFCQLRILFSGLSFSESVIGRLYEVTVFCLFVITSFYFIACKLFVETCTLLHGSGVYFLLIILLPVQVSLYRCKLSFASHCVCCIRRLLFICILCRVNLRITKIVVLKKKG